MEIAKLKLKEFLDEILKIVDERKFQDDFVPVGISNRHIHLEKKHVDILFGEEYTFVKIKDLSQTGQFSCKEVVTLCGPKGCIEKVRVLGPERKRTQVEISMGDSIKLGVKPHIRLSGDLKGTAGITIIGPKGSIQILEGVIVSQRHIHMTQADAERLGVINGEEVSIEIVGERGGIFHNTYVRVSEVSVLECHIDVDEANAFGISSKTKIKIIKNKTNKN